MVFVDLDTPGMKFPRNVGVFSSVATIPPARVAAGFRLCADGSTSSAIGFESYPADSISCQNF